MYCNKCGETLPPSSRFCNVCGAAVVGNKTEAARDRAPRGDYQQIDSASRPAAVRRERKAAPDSGDMARFGPDEDVIFTLRPTLVFVFVRYIVAALIVIATAALMGLLHNASGMINGMVAFSVISIVAVIAFAFPVYKHILRRREVYTLTNHKLEMRFGLLAKIVRNIPLRNIQDVTVTASAWQRLINIGDIEIDSASEGGKIVLDDIHYPERYANIILGELRRRN